MKKTKSKTSDELRSEYKRSDFNNLVRGKYAARVAVETIIVVLEPDIAKAFPNDSAVNHALRELLEGAPRTARVPRQQTGHAKQKRVG